MADRSPTRDSWEKWDCVTLDCKSFHPMPYRGRKQPPLSWSTAFPGPRTSKDSDRNLDVARSSVNELSRVLESVHLASTRRWGERTQESGAPVAQEIPPVNRQGADDIDRYVQGILAAITPSESDLLLKTNECHRLESIVQKVLPNAKLKIMGGIANTFALKDSDVDVCIVGTHGSRNLDTCEVNRLGNILRERGTGTDFNFHFN